MSLVKCKECKGQISTKADKCPHCGAKKNDGVSRFLWATALILMAFVGIMYCSYSSPSNTISHPNNLLAYNYAEGPVMKNLKSPSSAKFPSIKEKSDHTDYLGNGEYHINSWVESQNSFGASIRAAFSITVLFTHDEVEFRNFKLEGT